MSHGLTARNMEDHLISLDSEAAIALWRCFPVRSAGFPAAWATTLHSDEAVGAAKAWLEATRRCAELCERLRVELASCARQASGPEKRFFGRAAKRVARGKIPPRDPVLPEAIARQLDLLGELYQSADRSRHALAEAVAREQRRLVDCLVAALQRGRLREAIAWQSRSALAAVDKYDCSEDEHAAKRRDRLTALGYLQRYCTKNDTVGFFGPIAWSRFSEDVADLDVGVDEPLIVDHRHFFEGWAVNALASMLAKDASGKAWVPARRRPSAAVGNDFVKLPLQPSQPRSQVEVAALRLCDGSRSSAEVVDALTEHHAMTPANATAVLDGLEADGLLIRDGAVEISYGAEATWSQWLDRVPADVAGPHRARLNRLAQSRERVVDACGDADAVATALSELEQIFEVETRCPARRGGGGFYEARTPLVQEARRNVAITFGRRVLGDLRQPLRVLMHVLRWYNATLCGRVEDAAETVFARAGADALEFLGFFMELSGELPRVARGVAQELMQRWRSAIEPVTHHGVADPALAQSAVEATFPDSPVSWALSRCCAPDLMIAARDVEAIRRGDYLLVLGELHLNNTVLADGLLWAHSDPQTVLDWSRRDVREQVLLVDVLPPAPAKAKIPSGAYRATWVVPHDMPVDPASVLPLGTLYVERGTGERLIARERLSGRSWPLRDALFPVLGKTAHDHFQLIEEQPHTPRLRIGQLVLMRETWRLTPRSASWAFVHDPAERLAQLVDWTMLAGVPRHVFVKASSQQKPIYIDLHSPLYIELLVKLIRREPPQGSIVFTEMLPGPDDLWLTDASAERYTAELRCVMVDVR